MSVFFQNKVDAAQNRPTERDAVSAKSLIRPLNLAHLTVYFIMRLRDSIDPGIGNLEREVPAGLEKSTQGGGRSSMG